MQRMDYHFKITFSIKVKTLTFPLLGGAAVSIGIRLNTVSALRNGLR